MRITLLAAAVSVCFDGASAGVAQFKLKEIANPPANDLYLSGSVHMSLMGSKESRFESQRAAGAYNSTQYEAVAALTPCTNGKAGGYKCSNIDLYSYTSHAALGSSTGEGSSSWGWTSDTGREIIIVAQVRTIHVPYARSHDLTSFRLMAPHLPKSSPTARFLTSVDCQSRVLTASGEVSPKIVNYPRSFT